MMKAPDLDRGYMVNTREYYNRFTTTIDAALSWTNDGDMNEPSWAYLSSRCRPEAISPDAIFNGLLYSFGVVAATDGTHMIHMGTSELSRHPANRSSAHYIVPSKSESRVECPLVEVLPLDFDSALAALQTERPGGESPMYMRIDWHMDRTAYSLFAPCRYINFPNPEMDHAGMWVEKPTYPRHAHRYVQPISGPVLFRRDGKYHAAFVAAHVTEDGTARTEFSLWAPISFFEVRRGARGWRRWTACVLSRTWLGRYFVVGEYHQVVAVDGKCSFYRHSPV